jgi:isoleucyl-tRNA synthetase
MEGLLISVSKAKGRKCNRCWIYSPTVGENPEHPTICRRCAETVSGII